MKKLMIISLALVSMFTSANAQLLYKISGKDLKSPSYIVGTYHLAPVSFVNAIEGIPDALNNTEQVCGELDMEDMKKPESAQKMAVAMLLPHGKTLKSLLTEEEYTRLNKLLKDLTSADMSNPIVEAKFGNITPQGHKRHDRNEKVLPESIQSTNWQAHPTRFLSALPYNYASIVPPADTKAQQDIWLPE